MRDIWEELRRDGDAVAAEVLAAEGGSATDGEFARELGCTTDALVERAENLELFFVDRGGSRLWPRWQVGLVGLPNALRILKAKECSGITIATFFLTPSATIRLDENARAAAIRNGDRPLDVLRRATASLRAVENDVQRFMDIGS